MIQFTSREQAYAVIIELHNKEGFYCLSNPSLKYVKKIERDGNYIRFIMSNSGEYYCTVFSSEEIAISLINAYQYLLLEI